MRFYKIPLFALLSWASMPSSAQDSVRELSLQQALSEALSNNFSYQIAELDPQIALESVTTQEAAFDTEIFATGNITQVEQATTFTQVTGTSSDNRNWRAGARKRLIYGTTVTAQTTLDRRDSDAGVNNFPLSQSADISLTVRQPLLNGFGKDVNLAQLERARAGYEASNSELRRSLQTLLAQVEEAYWRVSRWQEQLELNTSNLTVSETLLEEAIERERLGMATQIEVLQARAFNAESKESIIETTRALGDAYDRLLALMGALPSSGFSIGSGAAVATLPEDPIVFPEFTETWTMALESAPALSAQEAIIEQRRIERLSAQSSTRPNLDLVVSGAYSGIDDETATEAYQNTIDRDGKAWSIGLEFSMPWDRRAEKAQLSIADKRLQQEELRYENFKQSLYQEVRSAWRSLQAVQQSVEAARLTVSLQEASFERERGKFEEGLSAFRDVLEAQRDLDQAQARLLTAKFNQLSAEIELANLTGTILERHGIEPLLPQDG